MSISLEEVRRIALLARLELTADEAVKMQGELSAILTYIDQLDEVETRGGSIEHPAVCLHADEPQPCVTVTEVEANAPAFAHGHFVVPRVIGGEP